MLVTHRAHSDVNPPWSVQPTRSYAWLHSTSTAHGQEPALSLPYKGSDLSSLSSANSVVSSMNLLQCTFGGFRSLIWTKKQRRSSFVPCGIPPFSRNRLQYTAFKKSNSKILVLFPLSADINQWWCISIKAIVVDSPGNPPNFWGSICCLISAIRHW